MSYYITADLSHNDYKDTATFSVSEKKSWANKECLSDWYVDSLKVATGEPKLIKLDGSYSYYPTSPSSDGLGWWSNQQSDIGGVFADEITISMGLPDFKEIDCLQINFGDTLPKSFDVFIDFKTLFTVTDISETTIVEIGNYHRDITLKFNEMQIPYSYLKINEISFGRLLIFHEDNSNDVKTDWQFDLLANSLPISTLDLSALNENNEFYSLNPNGIYKYFEKGQVVKAYTSEDGVRTPQGTFFLTEWEDSNSDQAKISAECVISLFEDKQYNNGLYYYDGLVTPSWTDCFNDVFSQTGLFDYIVYDSEIISELGTTKMHGIMPTGNARDVLRDLLIVTQTACRVRKDGTIYIFRPDFSKTSTLYEYYFDNEKITANEKSLSTAVVAPKRQTLLADRGKIPNVIRAVSAGNNTLTFDLTQLSTENDDVIYITFDVLVVTGETEIYSLAIDTENRFSNIDLRQNSVSFTFNSPGERNATITFKTYSYIDSGNVFSVVSKDGTSTGTVVSGVASATNVIDTLKPFFFSQCNGGDLFYIDSIAKYWQYSLLHRMKRTAKIKTDNEVDLSGRVKFESSINDVYFYGLITEIETDISGGMISEITLQGGTS